MNNEDFEGKGCKYRTFLKDYKISNRGNREEKVFIDNDIKTYYQERYSEWLHLKNLREELKIWRPCEYFDQLNIASASSHSILNYPIFLALLSNKKILPSRELLILDEAHLLETEIVRFRGLAISKRRWKKYIPNLKMVDYGYDDIEKWIDFLIDLERRMLVLTGNNSMVKSLSIFRRAKYNWTNKKPASNKKKIVGASEIFESDEEIAEKYNAHFFRGSPSISEELAVEVLRDTERLTGTINSILSSPKNWIVSEIKKENYEVITVELKPLDTSQYWKDVFEKCTKTLMMSATILDSKTFCESLGLVHDEVKFIQVGSDFPLQNRSIYPMNIAYLNFSNLKLQEVKTKISRAVDNLMTLHRNHKGIIHTTSYEQLNFIKENFYKRKHFRNK
jgi:ATP-dependent DNA helicase DinG